MLRDGIPDRTIDLGRFMSDDSTTCPTCGATVASTDRFCSSCGHAFHNQSDERRVVTVLFADLVGFTAMSETLDPERVKWIVDTAFERLVADVVHFGGRVDKIVGDGILALFGAPVAHEDDAERAVRAALAMQRTLSVFAAELDLPIRMRVGVNSGEVLVGALRAGGDYTAMGDVVNTASRLESLAEPGQVLVGASTRAQTGAAILYEAAESTDVRGRTEAVDSSVAIGVTAPPGRRAARASAFVGREHELSTLDSAVRLSIAQRRGQFIAVVGEAGVGKTRLLAELEQSLECAGVEAVTLEGRCIPYGEVNPWFPVAEVLRESCNIAADSDLAAVSASLNATLERLEIDESDVEQIHNGLLQVLGFDGPLRHLDPDRASAESTRAMMRFLEVGAERNPLVIRLGDLHWADQRVLDLIDQLVPQMARQPLVLLATARQELFDRWTPPIGRHNTLVLGLETLPREHAEELLDELVGTQIDRRERASLLDRSGGNPFFLEELATLVTSAAQASPSNDLPDTLRGLVAARLDLLAPELLQLVEDASVWGTSGPVVALDEIARLIHHRSGASRELEALVDEEIFDLAGDEWRFRSDLVRDVAYARLTKSDRLDLHQGIATYLDAAWGGEFVSDWVIAMAARHYGAAAALSRELTGPEHVERLRVAALRWISEAALRAEREGSWERTEQLTTEALELAEAAPELDAEAVLAMLLTRAHSRSERWDFAGSLADVARSQQLAEERGDARSLARAKMIEGEAVGREGDMGRGGELLEESIARFDAIGDRAGLAEALRHQGMAALFRGDHVVAEEASRRALGVFGEIDDPRGVAWALQNLAWVAFVNGRVADAETWLDESTEVFEHLGDSGGLAWTKGLLSFVRFSQGRFDESRELSAEVMVESERRGDDWGRSMMLVVTAGVDLWEGRTVDAVRRSKEAVSCFQELGDVVGLEQAMAFYGRSLVMSGSVREGLAAFPADDGPGVEAPNPFGPVVGLSRLAVKLQLGSPGALAVAETMLDEAGDSVINLQSEVAAVAVGALAMLGKFSRAVDVFDTASFERPHGSIIAAGALALAGAGAHDRVATIAGAVDELERVTYLDRVQILLARALGRGPDALDALQEARTTAAATDDVLTQAIVELAAAHVFVDLLPEEAQLTRKLADERWKDLGIDPAGWLTLFGAACATPAAPN